MRHARLMGAGAGKYWLWMSNVCYGLAGYRALAGAEAVERRSSPEGRTVCWAKGPGETKVPSEPGCRLLGLSTFLGALIPLVGGRVGPEAVAEADLGVFLAELVRQGGQSPGWGWLGKSERAGWMSQCRSEVH